MSDARPAPADAVRGVVRTTIDIAAPPERVFRALTDPAERAAWWRGPDGGAAPPLGEPRVVDPPRVLEHAWEAGDAAGGAPSTVRYELAPAEVDGAPGTRLTVTHTGPAVAAGGVVARAGGGGAVPSHADAVGRLARLLGGRDAPRPAAAEHAAFVVYAAAVRASSRARSPRARGPRPARA